MIEPAFIMGLQDHAQAAHAVIGWHTRGRDLPQERGLLAGVRQCLQCSPSGVDAAACGVHRVATFLPAERVVVHAEDGIDDVQAVAVGHSLDQTQADQGFVAELPQGFLVLASSPLIKAEHRRDCEHPQPEQPEQLQADGGSAAQRAHG